MRKRGLAYILTVILVLTSFSWVQIRAEGNYKYNSGSDLVSFYTQGKDVQKLFDVSISDVVNNIVSWALRFKTFVVFRAEETDNGTTLRGYFNAPNLQMLGKNLITKDINDGYPYETYDVNKTRSNMVKVGDKATKINAITKYGFHIPNYLYQGEIPKIYFGVKNIMPTSVFSGMWRVIKGFFGASFLEAPRLDEYQSMYYYNHGYNDKDDELVKFVQKYWNPYFKDCLDTSVYSNPESFRNSYVSPEEVEAAKRQVDSAEYDFPLDLMKKLYGNVELSLQGEKTEDSIHAKGEQVFKNIEAIYKQLELHNGKEYENWREAYQYNEEFRKALDAVVPRGLLKDEEDNDYSDDYIDEMYKGTEITETGKKRNAPPIPKGTKIDISDEDLNSSEMTELQQVMDKYVQLKTTAEGFDATLNSSGRDKTKIYYNQCLIQNQGAEGECWSSKYGTGKTSIAVGNLVSLATEKETQTFTTGSGGNSSGSRTSGNKQQNRSPIKLDYSGKFDTTKAQGVPSTSLDGFDENWIDNFDITSKDPPWVTAEYINDYVAQFGNSKFAGKGQFIKDMSDKYGISAGAFLGQAYLETSMGTVPCGGVYNFGCITCSSDTPNAIPVGHHYFRNPPTAEAGIEEYFSLLNNYVKNGITRYKEYIDTYSPPYDNDGSNLKFKVKMFSTIYNFGYGVGDRVETKTPKKNISSKGMGVGKVNQYSSKTIYNRGVQTKAIFDPNSHGELSKQEAVAILNTIRSYTGAYYNEVMGSLVAIMSRVAKEKDNKILTTTSELDPRVMPYDSEQMTTSDKLIFNVTDPRVSIGKSFFIGGVVSDLTPRPQGVLAYFKIVPSLIDYVGDITSITIALQQFANFDLFTGELSPASVINTSLTDLLIYILAMICLFRTVHAFYIYNRKSKIGRGRVQVIKYFLIVLIEIGIIGYVSLNPDKTWDRLKKSLNTCLNFGEELTFASDHPELAYLYGKGDSKDPATTYYIPYLDAWSSYNTGYGLVMEQQSISKAQGKPELVGYKPAKIGSDNIEQFSVLLADSFSANGSSESSYAVMNSKGETVNGVRINNNAYRVVDHFLAPRVNTTLNGTPKDKNNSSVDVNVQINENYNNAFQNTLGDVIGSIVCSVHLMFLSALKVLLFLYLWYKFYTFIYMIVFYRVKEKKKWSDIAKDIFYPLLYIMIIGMYAGIVIDLSVSIDSVFWGALIQTIMCIFTYHIIAEWYTFPSFPIVLKPIGKLVYTLKNRRKKRKGKV